MENILCPVIGAGTLLFWYSDQLLRDRTNRYSVHLLRSAVFVIIWNCFGAGNESWPNRLLVSILTPYASGCEGIGKTIYTCSFYS